MSFQRNIRPDNPRGFHEDFRVDLHGMRVWSDKVAQAAPQGWTKTLAWGITGRTGKDGYDIPREFCSALESMPMAAGTLPGVVGVNASNGVGSWLWNGLAGSANRSFTWGRANGYDYADPDKPWEQAMVRILNELHYAKAAGITGIGLDAFSITPPSRQRKLLAYFRKAVPGMDFCIEEMPADWNHADCPGFTTEPAGGFTAPPWLCDFMNPGHVTYCKTGRACIRDIAALGYVPVGWQSDGPLHGVEAARTCELLGINVGEMA
jgi:hypothetical protein